MEKLKLKNVFNYKKPAFEIIAVAVIVAETVACGMIENSKAKVKYKVTNEAISSNVIIYNNSQYGFRFSLPESWRGYTIVTGKWEGVGSQSGKTVETGPIIYIRHPGWTAQNPRQDIPIMIFTLNQWSSLQQGEFHIGVAPIGPTELGRNSRYIFALPARYNYAFLPGYEEVEKILAGNPLQPIGDNSQNYK